MTKDFLVELGTEELPPKSLPDLSQAFDQGIATGLQALGLKFSSTKAFATPRRLAVMVTELDECTPTRESVVWGPPAKVAFDEQGKPTKAGMAFAQKHSIATTALTTENDGKVDKLVYRQTVEGEPTYQLLSAVVKQSLADLPIAKRMRWGESQVEFVRPVHWLLMLFGDDVIESDILDLQADRLTYGHRFHCNRAIVIDRAADYEDALNARGFVIPDFSRRRDEIKRQVTAAAHQQGGQAMIDDDLLSEVTALVEWPVALSGRFEQHFLEVPAEALISSMKGHQKYFPVTDHQDKLMPCFIAVANIESSDPAQIIDGNERVIRPRLADAGFFYQTDKKTALADKRERLKTVIFQEKLGTVFQKTERIAALGKLIAGQLNSEIPAEQVERAGGLCKSDLVSDMVLEFADMQGIAGYYYAKHDGEPDTVAMAMKEHYLPRFAGDILPTTELGAIVALADRLDTLVGIFAIGQQPSGSKDPFALRRASLSVLRLLVEQQWDLNLHKLLLAAYQQYDPPPATEAIVDQVLHYVLERFSAWYQDQGIPAQVFQSVNAKKGLTPVDIDQRVQAVNFFCQLPAAQALAAANKRVSNILVNKRQSDSSLNVDENRLQEPAEIALASALDEQTKMVAPLFASRHYKEALTSLATLRDVVDDFFDNVMVMTDDQSLRDNRLALLSQLRELFLQVADISHLAVK